MNSGRHPLGETPPDSVFVLLDEGAEPTGLDGLVAWMPGLLPRLNWRSHFYLLGRERPPALEVHERVAALAACFLQEQGLATVHLHPAIALQPGDAAQRQNWQRLLAPAEPFQARAYEDQGEVRMPVLPIVVVAPQVSTDDVVKTADFFLARAARPSFYLAREPGPELGRKADAEGIRLYVGTGDDARSGKLAGQLQINHLFDTLLPRVEDDDTDLLAPCNRHLVVDASGGRAFGCFEQWKRQCGGVSIAGGPPNEVYLPAPASPISCAACIGRALLLMRANIDANQRRREGRRVLFRAAQQLSGRGENRLAAEISGHVLELCDDDRDRGAALIQQGLCLLALGEHQKAEEALENAKGYPVDRGAVAYYRGRVQFDWRDYIEALDRFAEALRLGCEQAPREDICFQMALCHINIEEYAQARPLLEQSLKPGQETAPVSFYRGICELGQGEVLEAMCHFQEALRLDPSPEDLGRVLFYVGTCFKELGRFDQAIEALQKAVRADPGDLANHNLLGFCYYKTKQHDKAVACFRRAVEIDPGSGIDWANLGSNLRDLGKREEAVAMYRKALSLDPGLDFARQNLARLTASAEEEEG